MQLKEAQGHLAVQLDSLNSVLSDTLIVGVLIALCEQSRCFS
jgi:hypothetical protein